VCDRGHAYFRAYDAGAWWLACCQCPHRILEGPAAHPQPAAEVIPLPEPEERKLAA
jgi:hypothetical protein